MMVIRFGSTLMCFNKIGSVHRATAPKPTNKMRFENVSIHHLFITIRKRGAPKTRHTKPLLIANHATSTSALFN